LPQPASIKADADAPIKTPLVKNPDFLNLNVISATPGSVTAEAVKKTALFVTPKPIKAEKPIVYRRISESLTNLFPPRRPKRGATVETAVRAAKRRRAAPPMELHPRVWRKGRPSARRRPAPNAGKKHPPTPAKSMNFRSVGFAVKKLLDSGLISHRPA
jgi:hypothetical protein